MLKLVSFIDSLPRVRKNSCNKLKRKQLLTANDQHQAITNKKSSNGSGGKLGYRSILASKIGKRRSTAPENAIEKDLQNVIPKDDNRKVHCNIARNELISPDVVGVLPAFSGCGSYGTLPLNRPSQIRTNPWCKPGKLPTLATLDLSRNTLPRATTEVRRPAVVDDQPETPTAIAAMSGSMTSSGYGSRDSSPASSVHSPGWQTAAVAMQISSHSDVGLQCDMAVDKSVDCTEADFEFDDTYESDACESSYVLKELNCKLAELRTKTRLVQRCAEMAKQERERRSREKQLCQEHMTFIKHFKLAISNGFEVVV